MKIRNKKIRQKVQEIIDLHDKMSGAYFFNPPVHASSRRSYERQNSRSLRFRHDNKIWNVLAVTKCSCKRVYYRLKIDCYEKMETYNPHRGLLHPKTTWTPIEKRFDIRTLKKMI